MIRRLRPWAIAAAGVLLAGGCHLHLHSHIGGKYYEGADRPEPGTAWFHHESTDGVHAASRPAAESIEQAVHDEVLDGIGRSLFE